MVAGCDHLWTTKGTEKTLPDKLDFISAYLELDDNTGIPAEGLPSLCLC